ncbi:hypothetical protein BGZ80_009671 [Entomortierella chlamydospora]|uniref:Uncharacterized protein n=1 Tax=Entomortierella chlamydospora TaxID=101097 RepID=A0A9P6N313_9FUNG|nr:hypothetical protein BGZ80_009671 [Entomortierella chlamydospora]
MSFNQRRSSISSGTSLAGNINPRRLSTYGHIVAGTGGLPSTHTAARSSTTFSNNKNGNYQNKDPHRSSVHGLNPFQHSHHRNQSIKARVARICPSLIHGSRRRKRNMVIMTFAGGIVILIFFLSTWDVKISSSVFSESSFSSFSSSQSQQHLSDSGNANNAPPESPVVYKNPDGTDMNPKSIFMIRDFGGPACQKAYAGHEHTLPETTRQEREIARTQNWPSITRADAWNLSLAWKRADDVSEELHESIASWGAVIRSLDDDASTVSDGVVQSPDDEAIPGSPHAPIRSSDIEDLKSRVGRNRPQLQKAMTIAALINSGFEDIIYYSPSTLPMQSPRLVFQQPDYIEKGTVFWQHPTSFPAHDSPLWPIIQSDCTPTTYEQTWSSFALRHKDSWKGLFLAWHWLSGSDYETYERVLGKQGNDLLRAAWIAVGRPFVIVNRMPEAGLLDLSRTKGDGIGCNFGSTLYPASGADVLENPEKYAQDQAMQKRLFQQRYRYGDHEEFFMENSNVMMLDTAPDSSLIRAGSYYRPIHKALNEVLNKSKDPTRLVLTDAYSAGSNGRVCLKISRKLKGHYHE